MKQYKPIDPDIYKNYVKYLRELAYMNRIFVKLSKYD